MSWKDNLDPKLKEHFDELILEVVKEKEAYIEAKDPSKAQLWSAIAILNKKVSDLELELKRLDKKNKVNQKLKKSLEKL